MDGKVQHDTRDHPKSMLDGMREVLGTLETAARKLKNQNFADLIKGASGRLAQASEHPDLEKVHEQLKGEHSEGETDGKRWPNDPDLGPTIGEWVDAGYNARNYPPTGYKSRSTPEEIAAAVATFDRQGAPSSFGTEGAPPFNRQGVPAGAGFTHDPSTQGSG